MQSEYFIVVHNLLYKYLKSKNSDANISNGNILIPFKKIGFIHLYLKKKIK